MAGDEGGDRISQLFNQALGEQALEQRQLHEAVVAVRAALVRIEALTGDQLRDTVRTTIQATTGESLDGALARGVGPRLSELRSALDGLDRRLDELLRRVDVLGQGPDVTTDLQALGVGLGSLQQLVADSGDVLLAGVQASLEAEVSQAVASVHEGLASLPPAATSDEVRAVVDTALESLPPVPTAEQVATVVERVVERLLAGHRAELPVVAPAPTAAEVAAEVTAEVTPAVERLLAGHRAELPVVEPAPTAAEVAAEVTAEVTPAVERLLAGHRAELPVVEPAPTAAEVAAEVTGSLAGLRADISEELAELVEDKLSAVVTGTDLAALRTEVSGLRTDLDAMRHLVVEELHAEPGVDVEALHRGVADAVAASEARLRSHVDEAVLALAEAVLSAGSAPGLTVGAMAPVAPVAPAAPLAPPLAPVASVAPVELTAGGEEWEPLPRPDLAPFDGPTPYGEPVDAGDDDADHGGDGQGDEGRRRGWFRRGGESPPTS